MDLLNFLKNCLVCLGCIFAGFIVAFIFNYAFNGSIAGWATIGIALIAGAFFILLSFSTIIKEQYRENLRLILLYLGLAFSMLFALFLIVILFNPLCIGDCGEFRSYPASTMKDCIRDLHSRGYGVIQPRKVTFDKGMTINRGELVADIPISAKDVEFFCEGSICGKYIEISPANDRVTANAKMDAVAVCCADEQRAISPKYCIAITDLKTPGQATNTCASACGVE